MKTISTEIESSLHRDLANLAWANHRSMKQEMRIAVEQYLKAHEKELAWAREFEEKKDAGKGTGAD